MSLRFYFGPTDGALGKQVYRDIIERSMAHPEQNFLILVPDQFTMQTQKELAVLHPRGGILNIDVLSFGRLGHRVLEEVGSRDIPVLDDTGKCLVIQKVAAGLKDQLPVLGGFLHKQGYIHEVKGAVSEFMQYGISPDSVGQLMDFAREKPALHGKLKDLQTIYKSFTEYIHDQFITTEETLDVLCRNLEKSRVVKDSVIVLDGFTGFTPIQYRLIGELMRLGSEVIVTLVCGREESPWHLMGEQNLFYLTQKTVWDLEAVAKENGVYRDRREDRFLYDEERKDVTAGPALTYLQEHLFRYGSRPFQESQGEIFLSEASTPREEVHQAALQLQELVRREGLAYRDIAMISGNLEGYAPYVETEFSRLGIPCFIDRTRGITLNPMTEFIKSALNLSLKNYTSEAVFHYLRSGLADIPREDVDLFENYILATGIRGFRTYTKEFTKRTADMDPQDVTFLGRMNGIRERFLEPLKKLQGKKKDRAAAYVDRLYDFLADAGVEKKLAAYSSSFEQAGDLVRAREYAQIWRLVMDLLNQVYQLLGDEEISEQEFLEILEAGFGEIQVGTIPQNVDRILVGDMERTRFKPVKVLFFLGVNDGNIPRNTSKGGILSDMEREFLKDSDFALAPTPRQQMFIQRFYLYLNMTKASEKLYLSYARQGSDGKAIRPAYLIDTLKKMYKGLSVEMPQNRPVLEQVLTPEEGKDYLAVGIRRFAQKQLSEGEKKEFGTLYAAYGEGELPEIRDRYAKAAFARYQESGLAAEIAHLLYGRHLQNSVSRLETFAGCAFRHFLQYGLTLKERQEYGIEANDLGTVYHNVLETFSKELDSSDSTWTDFEESFAREQIHRALEAETQQYGNQIFQESHRNEYQVKRMERILMRTVMTLQKQLKKGRFVPESWEVSFREAQEISELSVALSEREKMTLTGRIDRVDTCTDEDHVYVKIVDYKSGDKKFDLVALYYGLQLQLVVYMNAALEQEKKRYPEKEIVPAALLYYHIEDPMVETESSVSQEALDREILRSLRTRGLVNDDLDVVKLLDGTISDKSDVIPVEIKSDGEYGAHASVMSTENLKMISDFVSRKLRKTGQEILNGRISMDPCEYKTQDACAFCPYSKVCGFDRQIPGYRKRKLEDLGEDDVLEKMKQEQDGE